MVGATELWQERYDQRARRLATYEHYTEWPLMAAALVFLAAYAVRIIWPNRHILPYGLDGWLLTVTWVAFGIDYIIRIVICPDRWRFFKRNILDLLSIILPMARPLRLLRAFAALSVLNRIGAQTLHGRLITYITGGSAAILFVTALAVTDAERGVPGATIQNFGAGLWWAVVTMSTVGYGDMTPLTTIGRVIGVFLMTAGIIVPGIIAGTISSYIIAKMSSPDEELASAPPAYIDALSAEIQGLRDELAQARATGSGPRANPAASL